MKKSADYTCAGSFGIDEHDNIWVMPDLIWDRVQTLQMVDKMIKNFKTHKPLLWFLEEENIAKAFGPFLRAKMREERTYTSLVGMRPSADKPTRARSIQGRVQQRKLYLPRLAPWFQDAKNQMLRFPNGTHDDFVDFIALIGLGLDSEIRKRPPKKDDEASKDTVQSLLSNALARANKEKRASNVSGW
jgi:predicted phage terminase large subunit-like protein